MSKNWLRSYSELDITVLILITFGQNLKISPIVPAVVRLTVTESGCLVKKKLPRYAWCSFCKAPNVRPYIFFKVLSAAEVGQGGYSVSSKP